MSFADFKAFVNKQISYHEFKAKKAGNNQDSEGRAALHKEYAETFKRLSAAFQATDYALEQQAKQTQALQDRCKELESRVSNSNQPRPATQFSLTADDIKGLPPELLSQLSVPETDKQETMIVDLINDAGGQLSIDKILIGIYRKTKEVPQKRAIMAKVYRMINKGLIWKVPKRKAIYTTEAVSESEIDDPHADENGAT